MNLIKELKIGRYLIIEIKNIIEYSDEEIIIEHFNKTKNSK